MKRTGMPRSKKPINPQSPQGKRYQDEYESMKPIIHARSGGRCEILAAHDCDGAATNSPHHRKFRGQGGSNSVDNLLDTCFSGHNWIHQQLPREQAGAFDLIVPREDPEHAYQPSEG